MDDDKAIHSMLNSQSAESLMKAYKRLYKKEYAGTSKVDLVSKIKKKVRNYRQAYDAVVEESKEMKTFWDFTAELNELSNVTLQRYKTAAGKDMDNAIDRNDSKTVKKRGKGYATASKKLTNRVLNKRG